jgi:hypothetical protein
VGRFPVVAGARRVLRGGGRRAGGARLGGYLAGGAAQLLHEFHRHCSAGRSHLLSRSTRHLFDLFQFARGGVAGNWLVICGKRGRWLRGQQLRPPSLPPIHPIPSIGVRHTVRNALSSLNNRCL